ncbi:MAG: hypothetical protein VKL41_22715 [Snowella sp.]|nr:hypothetical protein [Snowella sp.]
MLKKLTIFFLAFTLLFSSSFKPVLAATNWDVNPSSTILMNSPKWEKFGNDVIYDVSKAAAVAGILTISCYAIDSAASTAFPPAIALMPVCNTIGLSSLTFEGINQLFKEIFVPVF